MAIRTERANIIVIRMPNCAPRESLFSDFPLPAALASGFGGEFQVTSLLLLLADLFTDFFLCFSVRFCEA